MRTAKKKGNRHICSPSSLQLMRGWSRGLGTRHPSQNVDKSLEKSTRTTYPAPFKIGNSLKSSAETRFFCRAIVVFKQVLFIFHEVISI
jgi:hypothetical protein